MRPAASAEERLLDEAILYHRIADRYGWTITETDAQPAVLVERMLIVADVEAEVKAARDRPQRQSG